MLRIARACVALTLLGVACGDGGEGEAPPVTSQPDPSQSGAAPSMPETGAPAPSMPEAGVSPVAEPVAPPEAGAPDATAPAAKPDAARPILVLDIPKASVPCGGMACDTSVDQVCCESWSVGTGFGSSQSCLTRMDCNRRYRRNGEQERAIPHECDGKEDCSGGQVCCMVADGMPLCDFADALNGECTSKVYGPGGSGICADNDLCKLGSTQLIALGVPLGVLACNDDSDCADRQGTKCQPEPDNSMTTGRGVKGRMHVKVCQ
jgi:hypothetical protein